MAADEHRIVVGVDGSDGSIGALRWAAEEAELRHATLEVVLAWEYPMLPYAAEAPPLQIEDIEAASQRTLEELVEHLTAPGCRIVTALVHDAAAAALINASRDADLLVVGSRGRGGFAGMLLGSVSQHCVQHAKCPVVVVRSVDEGD